MSFYLNRKQMLIGGGIVTGVIVASSVALIKRNLNKKEMQKEKELSDIIENLEDISNKIIRLTKTNEQLEKLEEQKSSFRDPYISGPY